MAPRKPTVDQDVAKESATTIIKCATKSIQVYDAGDGAVRYRVTINVAIDAIKKNTDGEYVVALVEYIDFVPNVLIAQCINHIPGLDLLYTKKKESAIRNDNKNGFGAAELQVILRDAKLEIERTKFEIGSEYTDKDGNTHTHDNAGYNTNIVKIKVSDKVEKLFDDMMDSVFEL